MHKMLLYSTIKFYERHYYQNSIDIDNMISISTIFSEEKYYGLEGFSTRFPRETILQLFWAKPIPIP